MRILILSAIFLLTPMATAAERFILNPAAKKFYIVDGDSVNYGKLHFRLCGIQAPERNHRLYGWTTDILRDILQQHKKIIAHVVDIDKYGRKVAVMIVRGTRKSANEQMVEKGAAYHFRRYSANCEPLISRRHFNAAEKRAKQKRLGVWRR